MTLLEDEDEFTEEEFIEGFYDVLMEIGLYE